MIILALAQVILCSNTALSSCGSLPPKDVNAMNASDLVNWCSGGDPQKGLTTGCTANSVIDWRQMTSSSWTMTTGGWYRVSEVPAGTTPEPPPTTDVKGSATVTWTAPTQNTDNSPLTDLAGYKVYYGQTKGGSYVNEVDAAASPKVISDLAAGTWYFVVLACNTSLACSDPSNEASKTITDQAPVQPLPPQKVTITTAGTWAAKKGSTNLKTGMKTHDECISYLGTQAAGKYSCAFSGEVVTVQ